MTTHPSSTPDDLAAVRSLLGPADPVPDPSLPRADVLSARAEVGLARAPAPARRPRRPLVVAGLVAVLSVATLVALVAVPASQDTGTVALTTGPGAQAISSAYAATAGAGTARVELSVSEGGRTVTATGVGDFESGAGRADIGFDGAGPSGVQVTIVRTEEGIFAKLPPGANPLSSDKPWVSVDAPTLARLTELALGDLGAQLTGAPLDALAYLKAVSGDVQVVGPDTVRGEATTRYRGSVDPAKVAEQLPPDLRPDPALAGQVESIPADLWIDGEGRLRRLTLAGGGRVPDVVGRRGPVSAMPAVTVELWDFGTPVDVAAPPRDQVVDVGGLLGGVLDGARRP